VSLRYDLGGGHPIVGRSVPDFELADGTTIGQCFRAGKGLFLDFNAAAPLEALAGRWGNRITYIAGHAKDRLGLSALLMRPDGFVAWASEGVPDLGEAAQALSRWYGEPG